MGCPLYVDFTRECISKFPDFLVFPTFDLCKSDDYKECLAYLIVSSPFNCSYLITCGNEYKKNIPKIITNLLGEKEIRDIYYRYTTQYCISPENHVTCAKYKLLSEGKTPPITLFPDGSTVHPMEIILKKKLIIHPPE
jgi:hypothetical protein